MLPPDSRHVLIKCCHVRYTTASSACCSKEQTIAVVDEQEGKQATTILRRTCYTKYKRRKDITDSQLRRMRDSLHDNKAEIKKLTYQMCDHMVKDTHYKLREDNVRKRAKTSQKEQCGEWQLWWIPRDRSKLRR